MITFGKAVLRRFLIGCIAAAVATVVVNGFRQTTPTVPDVVVPATPTARSAAGCDELIASGATDTCRVIDQDSTIPGGSR